MKHLYIKRDNCVRFERTGIVMGLDYVQRRLIPELPRAYYANAKILRYKLLKKKVQKRTSI